MRSLQEVNLVCVDKLAQDTYLEKVHEDLEAEWEAWRRTG